MSEESYEVYVDGVRCALLWKEEDVWELLDRLPINADYKVLDGDGQLREDFLVMGG